jgi:hypothetical protein
VTVDEFLKRYDVEERVYGVVQPSEMRKDLSSLLAVAKAEGAGIAARCLKSHLNISDYEIMKKLCDEVDKEIKAEGADGR